VAKRLRSWTAIVFGLALSLASVGAALADELPSPPREFRGVWIATVANIDWPSKPGLANIDQQAELVALLDKAAELNLNAVVVQVRPSADALYASKLEPWSEYLTGNQGQPPKPFYDPLKFAIEEAHKRGLQLHAWFNPYRVRQSGAKSVPAPAHVSRAMPELVRKYGPYLWFDPGEPDALARFIEVVTDVVRRYDLDGVHIDDYFYPYPIKAADGHLVPFPDDESFERAKEAGEQFDRDDWRRQNVDHLVERMYKEVKKEKPWVLVGISPFGIWRPGYPEGIQGFDQYASLYADAKKWLNEGWVDYFTPQLYWKIEGPQSYPKLLAWWHGENAQQRHLWPGNGAHNVRRGPDIVEARDAWPAEELIRQIELTREELKASPGNVHFSAKCLMDNRDSLADKLKAGVYAEKAVVPETSWLGGNAPTAPKVGAKAGEKGVVVTLTAGKGEKPWVWVVRVKAGDKWTMQIVPGAESQRMIAVDGQGATEVAVSAVSRLGREGPVARSKVE
jgi:uncharacterized lipoprotein YddW (UPF0748 family)